nr:hypothetical protein [Tanacetum cinerariifolium]
LCLISILHAKDFFRMLVAYVSINLLIRVIEDSELRLGGGGVVAGVGDGGKGAADTSSSSSSSTSTSSCIKDCQAQAESQEVREEEKIQVFWFKEGRMEESQAKAYNLDLQHSEKVFSMQDTDEAEPAKVEEVLEVVIAAKLMIEVVTTAAPITTASQVSKASTSRKGRGVFIQDPEETAAASVIVHTEVKS